MLFEDLGLPLHRADRRPQHRACCASTCGWSRRSTGPCCCTWSPRRGTASARRPRTRCCSTPRPSSGGARARVVEMKKGGGAQPTRTSPRDAIHAAMRPQRARDGHDRRDVPGQQARTGARRVPRAVLRRGHLRSRTPWPSPPARRRSGMRPIVDIYSTFLQRTYDQIFQEVALQNLPVDVHARPRRPRRTRRADAPRRVRPGLPARLPQHGRHGAGRRPRPAGDARLGAISRRALRDPLPQGDGGDGRGRAATRGVWQGGGGSPRRRRRHPVLWGAAE